MAGADWAWAAGFTALGCHDISANVAKTWTICLRRLAAKLLTRPDYLRMLLSPKTQNRAFLWSMFRLVEAYRSGAMRYGVLSFQKPA